MRWTLMAAGVVAVAIAAAGTAGTAAARSQSVRCVGGGGCYPTLAAALAAASDGDTIKVGPGTFAGGVTIDKSVSLVGAGANRTAISGGGPVLTIFRASNPSGLTVSISGVTITGGVNQVEQVNFGGGISIPPEQLPDPPYNGLGATVTIADSVVTRNVVTAFSQVPAGGLCGPLACAFTLGGGISNRGTLTLVNTSVTGNTSGSTGTLPSLASGAISGGIDNGSPGVLTLRHSVVSGNHATAATGIGWFAESGGIGSAGVLTIEDSVVSDNVAEITGSFSADDMWANASSGGIRVGTACCGPQSATIRNTIIRGNRVTSHATNANGVAQAFAGGIDVDGQLLLERSAVTDNSAQAVSEGDALADGGGMEVEGTATVRDSLIARNTVSAQSKRFAAAFGAGVANAGQLTLERTLVTGNSGSASGPGAEGFGFPSAVDGGGIWNGSFDGQSTAQLTLTQVGIVANSLSAPAPFLVRGGGIKTDFPITKTATLIAGNKPDGCFGC